MDAGQSTQLSVKSAVRTLDLIEYVVAQPSGVAAQEFAIALSIPISSLSYLLGTLVERGYLRRDGRSYHAGPGLDRLARRHVPHPISDRARPLIQAVRRQLNETTSLFERDGWELMVTVTETSTQSLRYALDVGVRTPLHCVSAGKAILAALPPAELDRYFEENRLERFTKRTVCDQQALRDELAIVRERGFANARNEYSIGICAVGSAISVNDIPIAAVSVAIPAPRYTAEVEREVIEQVLRTGRTLQELMR